MSTQKSHLMLVFVNASCKKQDKDDQDPQYINSDIKFREKELSELHFKTIFVTDERIQFKRHFKIKKR